jgi:CBS domain-containing protein
MKIRDIMSQDVATCREDDSLDRAAQLMWDRDVGSVPVVDGEGRPLGMITDRDICMAAYTQGEALSIRLSLSTLFVEEDRVPDLVAGGGP